MCAYFGKDLQEMLLERNAKKRHKQNAKSHIAYVGLKHYVVFRPTLSKESVTH